MLSDPLQPFSGGVRPPKESGYSKATPEEPKQKVPSGKNQYGLKEDFYLAPSLRDKMVSPQQVFEDLHDKKQQAATRLRKLEQAREQLQKMSAAALKASQESDPSTRKELGREYDEAKRELDKLKKEAIPESYETINLNDYAGAEQTFAQDHGPERAAAYFQAARGEREDKDGDSGLKSLDREIERTRKAYHIIEGREQSIQSRISSQQVDDGDRTGREESLKKISEMNREAARQTEEITKKAQNPLQLSMLLNRL